MPFPSHEVRWVFDGAPSQSVVKWFRTRDLAGKTLPCEDWPPDWREDVYIVFPSDTDMGIKLRDEVLDDETRSRRVEFKGLTRDFGTVHFGDKAVGNVQQWIKWSYKNDAVPPPLVSLFDAMDGSNRVVVKKKRLQRKVELRLSGNDREVPVDARVDRGLGMELTRLEIAAGEYWTLGFEAFPHHPSMSEDFGRLVSRSLETYDGELRAENSLSYPAWLPRFRESVQ